MNVQIEQVKFDAHLFLDEEEVRVLEHISGYSWDDLRGGGFSKETFDRVRNNLHINLGKLKTSFDRIRITESGRKLKEEDHV